MSSSGRVSVIQRAWSSWKALRLPWRRRFLVGLDLHGNTFWEFRDARGGADAAASRWRRIMEVPRTVHHGDVRVSPQWHQWLRYTRQDPPSLDEQRRDVLRQERMRLLAAEADARWAAKPSLVDAPVRDQGVGAEERQQQPQHSPMGSRTRQPADVRGAPLEATSTGGGKTRNSTPSPPSAEDDTEAGKHNPRPPTSTSQDDPWRRARGRPGEEWQPRSWTPPSPSTKRP